MTNKEPELALNTPTNKCWILGVYTMRELNVNEIEQVNGGTNTEYSVAKAGVGYLTVGLGFVANNAFRVASGAFMVGYYGATAMGAGGAGKRLGAWMYSRF